MKTGDLYQFMNLPIRILMIDDAEVFYQAIDDHGSIMHEQKRTLVYDRIPRKYPLLLHRW
jgi:hypothetical protein